MQFFSLVSNQSVCLSLISKAGLNQNTGYLYDIMYSRSSPDKLRTQQFEKMQPEHYVQRDKTTQQKTQKTKMEMEEEFNWMKLQRTSSAYNSKNNLQKHRWVGLHPHKFKELGFCHSIFFRWK